MRLIGAIWWMCALIVVPSFVAYLTSSDHTISDRRLWNSIGSIEDLERQYRIQYSTVKGSLTEQYLRRNAEMEKKIRDLIEDQMPNPRQSSLTPQEFAQLTESLDYQMPDKFTKVWKSMQETGMMDNAEQAIRRVQDSPSALEGYAFIGNALDIHFAELTNCDVMSVGREFGGSPLAIAVQRGSPLKDQLSSAIVKLLNQQEIERLKQKWWNRNPSRKQCPRLDERAQTAYNLRGLSVIIGIAIVLSAAILMIDSCCALSKRNNRKYSNGESDINGPEAVSYINYTDYGYENDVTT